MIPKIIHYCWFGGNPLPESAQKCISSWQKFLPDYEIKEWNESNFDVNIIPYTQKAYEAHKYAYVSDYARFWILEKEGGVYFDTDVEVIKPFDDILSKGGFLGYELPNMVNPGLGMAAPQGHNFLKKIIALYARLDFINPDINPQCPNVVTHTTSTLKDLGVPIGQNRPCDFEGIYIYPIDYFNPLNDLIGKLNLTPNTRSIHWYAKTWLKPRHSFITWLSHMVHRIFGITVSTQIRKLISRK